MYFVKEARENFSFLRFKNLCEEISYISFGDSHYYFDLDKMFFDDMTLELHCNIFKSKSTKKTDSYFNNFLENIISASTLN